MYRKSVTSTCHLLKGHSTLLTEYISKFLGTKSLSTNRVTNNLKYRRSKWQKQFIILLYHRSITLPVALILLRSWDGQNKKHAGNNAYNEHKCHILIKNPTESPDSDSTIINFLF